jgi:hypothetical protein
MTHKQLAEVIANAIINNIHNDDNKSVIEQVLRENLLGETGEFPDGKLSEDDGGEIAMAIGTHGETIIIKFGKQVSWIGISVDAAVELIAVLQKTINRLTN